MALIARYLVDTSAAARMKSPAVATRLAPLIEAGLVATTAQLDAEVSVLIDSGAFSLNLG